MFVVQPLAFYASSIVWHVAEQGIANTLGLATLRHGTNIINWVSIHTLGTIPAFGGNRTGGDWDKQYGQNAGRTFFSYAHPNDTEAAGGMYALDAEKIDPEDCIRSTSREYEFKSNVNLLSALCVPKLISHPLSNVITTIIPVVKVHLPDDKVKPRANIVYDDRADFQRDRTEYYSYSTTKWISPLNMGVIGSIWNSLTYKTPMRMAENLPRVKKGLIQLGVSVTVIGTVMTLAPEFVTANKTAMVAGLMMGMI